MTKILFSWDDGSIYDLKLANLMLKYNIRPIFFIPTINWEQPYIKQNEIKQLYNLGMEIGGHTVSHKYLTNIPKNHVENEIRDNKLYLEVLLEIMLIFFVIQEDFIIIILKRLLKNITKEQEVQKL